MPTDQERAQNALRQRRYRERQKGLVTALRSQAEEHGYYLTRKPPQKPSGAALGLEDGDQRRRDNRERQRRYRERKKLQELDMLKRMGHLEICTINRCAWGCHIAEYGPPSGGYDDKELTRWAVEHGYYDELHAR